MTLRLEVTKRTDPRLLARMAIHYSQPKGFIGRNICYAVYYNEVYYGHIVGGSATKHLQGRYEYLGLSKDNLNNIVNNLFFNINKIDGKYPTRNFTSKVVKKFIEVITLAWELKYGDRVLGFETLVEKPRTGDLYRKIGFAVVGETKGYTCKRVSGVGVDGWSGKRVWNTDKNSLRPKLVLCYKVIHTIEGG